MTDLFRRLAARSIGTERQLRPQLPGLFEPQGAGDDGILEVNEELARQATTPRRAEAAQDALDGPAAATPRPAGDFPAAARHGSPAPQPEQIAERPAPSPRPASAPKPSAKTIEREIRIEQRETLHERVVTELRAPPSPPATPPAAATPAATPRPPANDRPAAPPPVETKSPNRDAPQTTAPPSLQPLQAVVAAAREPSLHEDRPDWPPKAERRVHIHIDHIEVRQPPRPASTRPKAQQPANPAPNLDDYLRRRGS